MATINLQVIINHPAAISNVVRYARIDNVVTPTYITQSGVTNGTLVIQNVPNGQYRIGITPVYADGRVCQEVFQDTPACTGIISFSAVLSGGNIAVSYTINTSVPNFQINISYPNGGSFSQQYVNAGSGTVNVTPPAGVYGDYTVNIQPVCDADTGFLGVASAPAVVTVTPPNNSTLTNNDSTALTPLSLTSFGSGSALVFNVSNLAGSGGSVAFYLADAPYTSLVINYGTGSPSAASLVTGTGTYAGVLTANTITFNSVTTLSGVTITIT